MTYDMFESPPSVVGLSQASKMDVLVVSSTRGFSGGDGLVTGFSQVTASLGKLNLPGPHPFSAQTRN